MADNLYDLFEKSNAFDPFGPYSSRETRTQVINGVQRVIRHIHIEGRNPDGVTNMIDEDQFLCQECEVAWTTPGINAFMKDNKILCEQCLKKAKIKSILKALWSPFIKFKENK